MTIGNLIDLKVKLFLFSIALQWYFDTVSNGIYGDFTRFIVFLWTNILCVWQFYQCSIWIFLIILITEYEKWFNESIMVFYWQLQLQSLMETLSATEPHYIRCVKPNNVLKPAIFENSNIIQQLRCGVSMILSKCTFVFFFLIKTSILLFSYDLNFFCHLGCSWGHQDKLCWISYQTHILWVS